MSKKIVRQPHKCYDCEHAYLMQSVFNNPVVSECTITYEREVANTPIKCQYFKQRAVKAEIHPMIPCK